MKLLFYFLLVFLNSGEIDLDSQWIIQYKKGACYGQCPVFEITIDKNRKMTYEGTRFVDPQGIFHRMLTRKEFKKLRCAFKKAKVHEISLADEQMIMDGALTTIRFREHQIKTKLGTPKELEKAIGYLISLSPLSEKGQFKWSKIEHSPQKEQVMKSVDFTADEIIVQLKPGIEIEAWLLKYGDFRVAIKKRLVPNRPLYLLNFDPNLVEIDHLLQKMNEDADVDVAEKNNKVQMR